LKTDGIEDVLKDLRKSAEKISDTSYFVQSTSKTEVGKALNDLIRYYENNVERMKYGSFTEKGYLIGSGAVESAHRHIIQQRLKRSGQRWSIRGAQRIANIRAYRIGNRWEKVILQIKKAA